jgi:hypothetical protein
VESAWEHVRNGTEAPLIQIEPVIEDDFFSSSPLFKFLIVDTNLIACSEIDDEDVPGGTLILHNVRTEAIPNVLFEIVCEASTTRCGIYEIDESTQTPSSRQRRLSKGTSSGNTKGSKSSGDECPPPPCFSGLSTVNVKDKGIILMKYLKIGDKVLSKNKEYQTVYSFSHYHTSKPTEYLQIHLSHSKDHLEISGDHLMFLADKKIPVPAAHVKVGDKLVAQDEKSTVSSTVKVTKIKKVTRNGLFAPFTADGTLVVNGVLASNFITFQDSDSLEIGGFKIMSYHLLEHMFEMPHRISCTGLRGEGLCTNETYDKEGNSKWSALGIWIAKEWLQHGLILKVLIFLGVMSFLVPLYAVEALVTSPGAFMVAVAFAGALYFLKTRFFVTTKSPIKTAK